MLVFGRKAGSNMLSGTRGVSQLRKNVGTSGVQYDYSILPNSVQYRLPTEGEHVKSSWLSLPKLVFEAGRDSSFFNREVAQIDFNKLPLTTSKKLATRKSRPKSVKMLSRDFIEDSLYNPYYGYFSKEAVIFNPGEGFDFAQLKSHDDFMEKWLQKYSKYDQKALVERKRDQKPGLVVTNDPKKSVLSQTVERPSMQLWHTPTELFQPFYGEALGRYILVSHVLKNSPLNDLVIYEMGGGNGTLMKDILNYIKKENPEIYERTKYKIIEISGQLYQKQKETAFNMRLNGEHKDKVELINKSIFEWKDIVPEPCFFIGLEVFDNFSHDVVRYDIETSRPYQGYVAIDESGDFKEYFSPEIDPLTKSFLGLREETGHAIFKRNKFFGDHPAQGSTLYKSFIDSLNPLRNGLSDPEYIPTRLIHFFEILKMKFPNHQLLAADFSDLPERAKGYTSPVVQTMHKNRMITSDTYMVNQGYFDIMFPTNFDLAAELYRLIVGKVAEHSSHAAFLNHWADTKMTTTKSGENPMLEMYTNASFLYS